MQNKSGRIVSKEKHATAKKEMRLVKAGYGSKKGKFGFVKLGNGKGKSRKMRGGSPVAPIGTNPTALPTSPTSGTTASTKMMPPSSANNMTKGMKGGKSRRHKRGGTVNLPLSPSYYDGKGVGTSGVALQFIAGQGN